MNMADLRVMVVLQYKEDMIALGIIPKDVKWDELTEEQQENVKKFIKDKVEGEVNKNDISSNS